MQAVLKLKIETGVSKKTTEIIDYETTARTSQTTCNLREQAEYKSETHEKSMWNFAKLTLSNEPLRLNYLVFINVFILDKEI